MMRHEKYNKKCGSIFNKTVSGLNNCGAETMGAKLK
jgi:hypothetical protein